MGKYESNAIALKLSLDTCQKLIDNYESLVDVLSKQRAENTSPRYSKFSFNPWSELAMDVRNFWERELTSEIFRAFEKVVTELR